MARKRDRPNLREDVAFKRVLEHGRHFIVRSNDLQGVEVREGFDGSYTGGENCCYRVARENDTHAPAQTFGISSRTAHKSQTYRTCEAISWFSQTKELFRINDSPYTLYHAAALECVRQGSSRSQSRGKNKFRHNLHVWESARNASVLSKYRRATIGETPKGL